MQQLKEIVCNHILHDALISAEVDGRLDWVVEIGDRVKQGESLATIDDRFLQLELQNNEL